MIEDGWNAFARLAPWSPRDYRAIGIKSQGSLFPRLQLHEGSSPRCACRTRDTEGLRTFLEKAANRAPFGVLVTLLDGAVVRDPRIVCLPLSSLMLLR